MAEHGPDAAADLIETLSDLARAVIACSGEAATTDVTRVPPAAARSDEDEETREGEK